MMLLVLNFFGFITQSIYDIMRGQTYISSIFIFDVLATILLNQFSILLYTYEYNLNGGSSFLFNLRFQASVILDTICFILSAPLIRTATRQSEFGHGYGLCMAQMSQILLSLVIVTIKNDNNLNNAKFQQASLAEIQDQLKIKNQLLTDERNETLKELLDNSCKIESDITQTISTRCSADNDQSMSSISTDGVNEYIKISMHNHLDVNQVTRSKMCIRIHYDQVRVEDLQVNNQEISGNSNCHDEAVILYELNINQITDDKKYQSTTIKRRWTEIIMMKKELALQLDTLVFESLPNIEDNQICKAEQLNEVSIRARIECLNQFFKELITLDARLECFSNFFNKDYNIMSNEENEDVDRISFISNSKGITLTNQVSQNLNETKNNDNEMSASENDTIYEIESISQQSSTDKLEVLVVREDVDKDILPTAVITNNIQLTAKQKQVLEDIENVYNNTWYIKIQIKLMQWNHEIKKEYKEIYSLQLFLKKQTKIDQKLSNEIDVKREFLKSQLGESIELTDEELDNVYEELRSDYEDFLQYIVSKEYQMKQKQVRSFFEIPNDLNDLINI